MKRKHLLAGIALLVLATMGAVIWASGNGDCLPGNYFLYELDAKYDCMYPSISPDGTEIAYVAAVYPDPDSCDLWIVDTRTWHTRQLTSCGDVSFRPYWNPSGDTIAFSADRDIWTIKRNGDNLTRLTDDRSLKLCRGWSPDGKRIAYLLNHSLWVMDTDGRNTQLVINGTSVKFDTFPVWSPDSTKIAVSCPGRVTEIVDGELIDELNPQEGLLIVGVDEGSYNLLEVGDCSLPAWSPDGDRIAYVSADGIRTVRHDGSGNRKISDDRVYPAENPKWLPSGDMIVYLAIDNLAARVREIRVVNADGTGERAVTPMGVDISFSVSGDGKIVAYGTLSTIRLSPVDGINWCKPFVTVLDIMRQKNLWERLPENEERPNNTVVFTLPQITYSEPAERIVNDTVGVNRTFTVVSDEPSTMRFSLDGDIQAHLSDTGVLQASYTFGNVSPGAHTVIVSIFSASNTSMGTTLHSWTWNVFPEELPEPSFEQNEEPAETQIKEGGSGEQFSSYSDFLRVL